MGYLITISFQYICCFKIMLLSIIDVCLNFLPLDIEQLIINETFHTTIVITGVRVMVFNATFNSIAVIQWRIVLLVEETRVPGENTGLSHATDKLYHIMWHGVHIGMSGTRTYNLIMVIGTDCIGCCSPTIIRSRPREPRFIKGST